MTFGAPLALIGLVVIPALALWYVRHQRGQAGGPAAFATPALVPSVAPNRPGWRRHVPLLAFLAALAALVVALADPRVARSEPVESSAIMLACDVSGSMAATDVAPTRIQAAEHAARRFLDAVPSHVSVGAIVFDQQATVLQAPTTDRAADRRALRGWRPHGGTAIGTAIERALAVLGRQQRQAARPTAAIVLLSDGGSTSGAAPLAAARQAKAQHVPIYTVALGTPQGTITVDGPNGRRVTQPVPPDPTLLAAVARASGGQAFTVRDAGHLNAVYERLGVRLGHHRVVHKLEAGFAGAALILMALGSALSLRWFGRLA